MSSLFRAWYVFLGLGLLTFVFVAFVGRVPSDLSAAVALPQNLPYRIGVNLRGTVLTLVERSDLRARLETSEAERAALAQRNRELELQLERYREILRVREDQSSGVVMTAPVTGVSAGAVLDRLTIGRGRRDGVLPDMPVTVPEGLVGIVTDVAARSAVVRAVTDPQSRVGVTVRGRGGQGVAVGEVGGLLRVINYVRREAIAVGDLVETQSYGGLYPRGILVGEVIEVLPADPNELRRSFLVRPAVDLPTLLEVALIAPR